MFVILWVITLRFDSQGQKKKYAVPFFFFLIGIYRGKTEIYLVSFCLNSFRDLTLQITFNSRDGATLNKILSLIGQSCD